jgi:hypothetical protein
MVKLIHKQAKGKANDNANKYSIVIESAAFFNAIKAFKAAFIDDVGKTSNFSGRLDTAFKKCLIAPTLV